MTITNCRLDFCLSPALLFGICRGHVSRDVCLQLEERHTTINNGANFTTQILRNCKRLDVPDLFLGEKWNTPMYPLVISQFAMKNHH